MNGLPYTIEKGYSGPVGISAQARGAVPAAQVEKTPAPCFEWSGDSGQTCQSAGERPGVREGIATVATGGTLNLRR